MKDTNTRREEEEEEEEEKEEEEEFERDMSCVCLIAVLLYRGYLYVSAISTVNATYLYMII
jgi:hypothetical protein